MYEEDTYRVLTRTPMVRDHVKDPTVEWRIILKWILKKEGRVQNGLYCFFGWGAALANTPLNLWVP